VPTSPSGKERLSHLQAAADAKPLQPRCVEERVAFPPKSDADYGLLRSIDRGPRGLTHDRTLWYSRVYRLPLPANLPQANPGTGLQTSASPALERLGRKAPDSNRNRR
jgi:hypothetical protein